VLRILDKILVITFVVIMTDLLSMLTTTLYEEVRFSYE